METNGEQHVVMVKVYLGDTCPATIRVELYANGVKGSHSVRQEMTRVRTDMIETGGQTYCATVSSARPATDYTARIIPHRVDLNVPLEADWILWQK